MYKSFISLLLSFAFVFSAAAQTTTPRSLGEPLRKAVEEGRQEIKTIREEGREELKTLQERARQEIKTLTTSSRESIKEKRDEFRAEVEVKRTELRDRVEARKTELREELQKIKDERKKSVVEGIDERLAKINEDRLKHFSNVLDQIAEVLERVVSRTDKAEANGLDVSAVRVVITDARTAIDAGRSAITTQYDKEYKITITDETTLRADVGEIRLALQSDLGDVRDAVVAARDSVRKAAVALAQIPRVDELGVEESTTTNE